ncbi:MAG: ribosome maturation factor RimM [Brevinematia bacterium]
MLKERFVDIGRIIDRFKLENQIKIELLIDDEEFIKVNDFYIKTLTGYRKLELSFEFKTPNYIVYRVENLQSELLKLLKGKEIYTKYENLPKLKEDEYYFIDLEECNVFEDNGELVGKVRKVIDNGKLYFLEFEEYIIPFSKRYIKEVNIHEKKIVLSSIFSEEKEYLK